MIRVSIQLSPKSKVVDFLVLCNFYFGQISSSYIKFGALDGQSRLKSHKFGYCAPVWSVPRRPRRWGRHASRRRTSPIVHTLPSLSARSRARFRLPVPLPRVARSAQQSRATLATARRAGADSGHLSPPCLDSSRCKPRNLALHLLRSISCSIEPSAGRNRSRPPRPPLLLHAEVLPRRRAPLPDLPPSD